MARFSRIRGMNCTDADGQKFQIWQERGEHAGEKFMGNEARRNNPIPALYLGASARTAGSLERRAILPVTFRVLHVKGGDS